MLSVNFLIAVTSPTLDPSTKGLRTGEPSQPIIAISLANKKAKLAHKRVLLDVLARSAKKRKIE